MAIPVILKGDTSAKIPLALADGFKYEGCSLVVECCGIIRSLSKLEAGGSIAVNYSADETALMPLGTSNVYLALINANGEKQSLPFAKLKVTDSPAEVYDAPIVVDPGLMSIDALPTRFNDEDVRNRANAIIAWMKRGVAVLAFAALPAFGAGVVVQTAPKGQVYNDQPIVTNVVFDTSSFASANDIAELKDTLKNGIVNRAASIGTANAWIDATGAVWQIEWDVAKDWWTIEPQPNDMQVFWDGDSWVLRYEGYNNDTKRGADVYKFSFNLGQTYTATRHPGGATNCVGKLAMVQDIDAVKDTLATNLIKTVINNGTYNLTYDPVLKVTWRKEAENGVFYEKCYTNINMIGVSK